MTLKMVESFKQLQGLKLVDYIKKLCWFVGT